MYGEHGFVQITESYSNLAFRQKAVITLGANGRGSYSFNATLPMVCVRSSSPVALLGSVNNGTSWTLTLNGTPGATVTAYVFDEPVPIGSNFGLQVYKQDGTLAFDSNMNYMKIVGVLSPPGGAPGYNQTWESNPLPAGAYAACVSYTRMGIYSIPGSDVIFVADHVYTTATGGGLRLQGYATKGIWDQGDGNGLQIESGRAPQVVLVDVSLL
ncbi:hypothetical protein [Cupriavidus sp. WS]|uniref:hypothetical protein n=1 Tax=Cupriavidus sp. WS TaxID=1312922 RepID=UPI001E58CC83|nr:hypothetical protein [Cupriavidus sp. WS]